VRYILVEYEYGFERTHEYSYSQVYTRSIPWLEVKPDSKPSIPKFVIASA
jgi:hypothetical protein